MILHLISTVNLGSFYVLAENVLIAKNLLENELNNADYGFFSYREITDIKIVTREIPVNFGNKKCLNFSDGGKLIIQKENS